MKYKGKVSILTMTVLFLFIALCSCSYKQAIIGTWYKVGVEPEEWNFCEDGQVVINDESAGEFSVENDTLKLCLDAGDSDAIIEDDANIIRGNGYMLVRDYEEAKEEGEAEFEIQRISICEKFSGNWHTSDGQSLICTESELTHNDMTYDFDVISENTLQLTHEDNAFTAKYEFDDDNTLLFDIGGGSVKYIRDAEKKP